MKKLPLIIVLGLAWACGTSNKSEEKKEIQEPAAVEETVSDSSYVFFKSPADGSTVASPVFIEMGVSGMEVEPAGQVKEGFGHHHILINQASWPEGQVIPASDSTIHFGKGQTDTSLELPAGEYTISLQFADGVHTSYGESMATSINIIVE